MSDSDKQLDAVWIFGFLFLVVVLFVCDYDADRSAEGIAAIFGQLPHSWL